MASAPTRRSRWSPTTSGGSDRDQWSSCSRADTHSRAANHCRGLPYLDHALYTGYEAGDETTSNVHFMIAEGDIVIMEFDATFTGWEGEAYHNYYCLVFVLRDGKIAEVREHADTKYVWDTLLATSEKRDAVQERLRRLRAGEAL